MRMKYARRISCMVKMRNENRITAGTPEERPKRKWKDNMKFNFKEIGVMFRNGYSWFRKG
jgi:hypothetical protein